MLLRCHEFTCLELLNCLLLGIWRFILSEFQEPRWLLFYTLVLPSCGLLWILRGPELPMIESWWTQMTLHHCWVGNNICHVRHNSKRNASMHAINVYSYEYGDEIKSRDYMTCLYYPQIDLPDIQHDQPLIIIHTSSADFLRDDGLDLYQKLQSKSPSSSIRYFEARGNHVFSVIIDRCTTKSMIDEWSKVIIW